MGLLLWFSYPLTLLLGLVSYIYLNDRRLRKTPSRASQFSPDRSTVRSIKQTSSRLAAVPVTVQDQVPPKTGRRYIVIGGGGFLGGWIATQLLERGEDYARIRLLDLNPPTNHVVIKALSQGTEFLKVDVTDASALEAAFKAPWNDQIDPDHSAPQITVFHTASNIRFYERHPGLVERSARVNVVGTENIIKAAKAVGADILIYTSSGSVAVRRTRLWLWPWETEPKHFVQVINDDENILPKRHEEFFSNYAVTKIQAERVVRTADKSKSSNSILRTGCVRPGNGIFGPRGDMLCGAYLVRQTNPSWIKNILQSFSYVENCAIAHLLYEQRLIELQSGGKNPDIGGDAFCIADPGPPATYEDVYNTLETLSEGECHFPSLSPTAMLLLSHIIEFYYTSRSLLLSAGWKLANILPPIDGDLINLQPPLFFLTQVHLIFDDSRARLPPEKGGLGYEGAFTTLEGVHKTHEEYKSGIGRSDSRSAEAGISFGFKRVKAQRGIGKMNDKITEKIGVSPVEVLSVK